MATLENVQDAPDYLKAADSHNILGDGKSWFDVNPANAGKFLMATGLSAANGFYRTAQTVGNWFSANETKLQETGDLITSFDSDLGKYYRENERLIDISGGIVGSILPGLAGVKGLTLLQSALNTGKMGSNLSIATNLLVPNVQKFRVASAAEINSSLATLGNINMNTVKALGAGIHQNVLEAAAAETVIALTMGAAPMLDNHDAGDIVKNIFLGTAVGGVIGGTFSGIGTFRYLNKSRAAEDVSRRPFTSGATPRDALPSSDKLILRANNLEFEGALPLDYSASYGVDSALYLQKVEGGLNAIRTDIREMSSHNELGNLVADLSQPKVGKNRLPEPGYANEYFQRFANADEILLPKELSRLETEFQKQLKAGVVTEKEFAPRFISLMGDNAGAVHASMPVPMTLADMYKGKDAILKAVNDYGFKSNKAAPLYNPLDNLKPGFKTTDVRMLYREMDARYIWSSPESGKIVKLQKGMNIHEYDLPLLQRAYQDEFADFNLIRGSGATLESVPASSLNLGQEILASKQALAEQLIELLSNSGKKAKYELEDAVDMAANLTDTSFTWIASGGRKGKTEDVFVRQNAKAKLQASLIERGVSPKLEEMVDPMFLPKFAKVIYKLPTKPELTENLVNAVASFTVKQKEFDQKAKEVTATILGKKEASKLFDITDNMLETANRNGDSPGMFSGQNGNYGTLGSFMAKIGGSVNNLLRTTSRDVQDSLTPALTAMGNKLESAIEHEAINQQLTRSTKKFILQETDEGKGFLVTREALKTVAKENDINVAEVTLAHLDDYADDVIEVTHPETWEVLRLRNQMSQGVTDSFGLINQQRGAANRVQDSAVVRPVRPDFKKYPHFSLIKDESVTGGETTMIWAASAKELTQMEDQVRKIGPHYRVINKANIEEYKIARGEYELAKSMNSYQIDSELQSKGVMSNFFPKTDPQTIINEILQHHVKEKTALVRETVRMRYQPVFDKLTQLGKVSSRAETSRFGSSIAALENASNNPYLNYIKTALDISKINEHPLYFGAATLAESAFSKPVTAIREAFRGVKSAQDLEVINKLLDRHGLKPAYQTAAIDALANHTAPKGELTAFVRGANGLLSLFTLGLDQLNALNNAISSNILRGTETRHLVEAINAGNTELAGDLAKLSKIKLPGTESEIISPMKLQAQAYANFYKDMRTKGNPLLTKYKNMGLVKDHIDQFKLLLDDFTLTGNESVSVLRSKLDAALAKSKTLLEAGAEKGQKWTGNKLAEEMNRFVSANVMDQLTSLGRKHGLMTAGEATAYINTFVNRVDGNLVASQRPLVFQGPIGQAIGLFQSYQFNLLQQLFRYIGEGTKKDMAMLMGLQSTLYGMQSLPGFQFINSHIVGTASGNKDHVDLYDATYGALGKNLGNWFLYGSPSFILQTNLYTRGDINPRHLTLLPTNLMDVPAINGWSKFFGNLYETATKLGSGGKAWETILQGIEHNGVSRPLAGIAQTLQGIPDGTVHSTTNQGSLLYGHDLLSIATGARLMGGRPLDESVINDTMYRHKFYEAYDREKRGKLSEVIKTNLMEGGSLDEKQVLKFAENYAESGGKQENFNKYMMELYKNANVTQAEQLRTALGKPMSYKIQLLMDGSSSFND